MDKSDVYKTILVSLVSASDKLFNLRRQLLLNCDVSLQAEEVQGVLDIRHYEIRCFSFTSILNCYSNFNTKNDNYRGVNDGCRTFYIFVTFHWSSIYVVFDIRSILTGTNRDGYRGLPVLCKLFCHDSTITLSWDWEGPSGGLNLFVTPGANPTKFLY